ncbi:MAG: type VI secretion system-associated protein TagF [Gammaproteobacteria bacterium]|nr:type VI secretion system-associated protein TagF [Gammaproteobacteria bacterium]MBI5615192.1 type VI secretion system-associated protein TagF [Gammaproteobacteria bacterium]
MDGSIAPGFYGKVPGLGDFITRRLPRAFVDPWDAWLQQALHASRGQLGEGWLDAYLTSPLWRFVLDAGLGGPEAWAGVMMPSVDRVGRYFPLTLACPLAAGADPCLALAAGEAWFTGVEDLLLAALDDEEFDVDAFEARVTALPPAAVADAAACAGTRHADGWNVELPEASLAAGCAPALSALARASFGACSFWLTTGSETIAPQFLVRAGLPAPLGFTAFLSAAAAPAGAAGGGDGGDYSALLADE